MKGELHKVFVSIGSNIEKEHNLISAIRALQQEFGKLVLSSVYESQAVGFEGEHFYNMVAGFDTLRQPRQIRDTLRKIEYQHHRTRGKNKFESRTLDLDQLLYDDLVIDDGDIQVPNADIAKYTFILYPISDLIGDMKHPLLDRTFAQLRNAHKNSEVLLRKFEFSALRNINC